MKLDDTFGSFRERRDGNIDITFRRQTVAATSDDTVVVAAGQD